MDSHGYAGPADMEAMVDLVRACWRENGPRTIVHAGDIYWWLQNRGHRQADPDIHIWTDEEKAPAGFAWMFAPRDGTPEADILVRPDRRGSGIESEMLRWLEERAKSMHAREGQDLHFDIGGYGDPQWESYIEGQGYVLGDTALVHFWQSLDEVPDILPPPGFHVQGSSGESDAFERDSVLGLSNSRSGSRREFYIDAMRTPGYRNDLDLAVVSESGDQVAMCIAWLDSDNKVGEFEPVACLPDYRRRGLSRAMIVEGLRRLKALGAESAIVYTWSTNEPAIRLYESCGFRELFRDRTYTKALQGR